MPREPHFTMRMPAELRAAATDLAARSGTNLPSMVRELVALAVRAGSLTPLRKAVFPEQYQPPPRVQLGEVRADPGGCTHPVTARRHVSTRVECGVCGAVVRHLGGPA